MSHIPRLCLLSLWGHVLFLTKRLLFLEDCGIHPWSKRFQIPKAKVIQVAPCGMANWLKKKFVLGSYSRPTLMLSWQLLLQFQYWSRCILGSYLLFLCKSHLGIQIERIFLWILHTISQWDLWCNLLLQVWLCPLFLQLFSVVSVQEFSDDPIQ